MNRTWRKILLGSIAAIILLGLAGGGYAWYIYHTAQETVSRMYRPIEPLKQLYVSTDPEVPKEPVIKLDGKNKSFTVLIMGSDERANERGRTDTLILLAVNPVKQSVLMFSIPRDSRTEIIGRGTTEKINHAYAYGGIEESIDTVEHFLDYPIDYYIHVDMQGFVKAVDLLGGVQVNNQKEFQYNQYAFKKGTLQLTGEEALAFSRMRKEDPRGDFGRNDRQREILHQLMIKSTRISNVTQLDKLMREIGEYAQTNLTFQDIKSFLYDYRDDLKHMDTAEIKGTGQTIDGIWYYVVDQQELTRLHNVLKSHQLETAVPSSN